MATLCECGCGLPAPIAKYTDNRGGWRKGEPVRFIQRHHAKLQVASPREFYSRIGKMARGVPHRDRLTWNDPDVLRQHIEARLRVDANGCWIFGIAGAWGYGAVSVEGTHCRAHRAMWRLVNGPIPNGLLVCHKCDVRLCVNPDHLFLGTHADNMLDMVSKGRSLRGEKSPTARLSYAQVLEIRARYREQNQRRNNAGELAAEFGVSRGYIVDLAKGLSRVSA